MTLEGFSQETISLAATAMLLLVVALAAMSGQSHRGLVFRWWALGSLAETFRFVLAISSWHFDPHWFSFPTAPLQAMGALFFLAGAWQAAGRKVPVVATGCVALAYGAWGLAAPFVPIASTTMFFPLALLGAAALSLAAAALTAKALRGRMPSDAVGAIAFGLWAGVRLAALFLGPHPALAVVEPLATVVLAAVIVSVHYSRVFRHRGEAAVQLAHTHPSFDRYFEEILDAVPVPMAINRYSDGAVLYFNHLACTIFGFTREQAINLRDTDFFLHPDELEKVGKKIRESSSLIEHELWMKKAGGAPVLARVTMRPVTYRGETAALVGINEITDLRDAEQEARSAEETIRLLLANSPILICAMDPTGVITLLEGKELASLGLESGETVGKNIFDLHAHLPERVALLRRALKGEAITTEIEIKGVQFNSHHQPLFDKQGNVSGLVVVSTNITPRKKAEREHRLMATAVEQAADLVLITETDGTVTYANPAFSKTSGYTPEEIVGESTRILKSGQHDRSFYDHLWGTLKQGEIWKGHFSNRGKDGSIFEVDSTISPLRDASGKVTHYIAVEKDITEQYHLESQLRQAQRLETIGSMAGTIAHDFNNLLSPIIGYTQLLQARFNQESQEGQDLAMILSGATRGKELIGQILTFAKQKECHREALALEPLVEEALSLVQHTSGSLIEIRRDFPEEPGLVFSDPILIHQVLVNLCLNATQAMPEGGELRVGIHQQQVEGKKDCQGITFSGDFMCLTVEDTGMGMDLETQARVFYPFFTTKGPGKGTGLGLSTVLRILQNSASFLTLESAPGQGARFQIFLPRYQGEPSKTTAETPEATHGQETILYVDDEEAIVRLATRSLEAMGYRVTGLTDSRKALALFENDPQSFDLVITDLNMPDLPGDEFADAIKKVRGNVPILLCTGFADTVEDDSTRGDVFCGVLHKPFRLEILGAEVRSALQQRVEQVGRPAVAGNHLN